MARTPGLHKRQGPGVRPRLQRHRAAVEGPNLSDDVNHATSGQALQHRHETARRPVLKAVMAPRRHGGMAAHARRNWALPTKSDRSSTFLERPTHTQWRSRLPMHEATPMPKQCDLSVSPWTNARVPLVCVCAPRCGATCADTCWHPSQDTEARRSCRKLTKRVKFELVTVAASRNPSIMLDNPSNSRGGHRRRHP